MKNILLITAVVFSISGTILGILCFVAKGKSESVLIADRSKWEDDFKWFDVELKMKDGSNENISIGIPLKDIDFSKAEKYDSSFSSPLSVSYNLCWIIKQGNPLRDKNLIKNQYHVTPAMTIEFLAEVNDNAKLLDILHQTSLGKNPKDSLLCFAMVKYKNLYMVMERGSNSNFTNKWGNISYVAEKNNGKWKYPRQDNERLREIDTLLSYYDEYRTIQSCWERTRGETFPANHAEYVKSR